MQLLSSIPTMHEIFSEQPPHFLWQMGLSDQMTMYMMMQRYFDQDVPVDLDGPIQAVIRKDTKWNGDRSQNPADFLEEILTLLVLEVQVRLHIPIFNESHSRGKFTRIGGILKRKVNKLARFSKEHIHAIRQRRSDSSASLMTASGLRLPDSQIAERGRLNRLTIRSTIPQRATEMDKTGCIPNRNPSGAGTLSAHAAGAAARDVEQAQQAFQNDKQIPRRGGTRKHQHFT